MKEMTKKRKNLKKKFRSRKPVFGAWMSLGHSSIAEIFCQAGFDFLGIDMEHSTISLGEARQIITACHELETPCLARAASHNQEMIKRLLDAGADGIILPNVNTSKAAEDLIAWSKYPPLGRRSFGVARAQGYGFQFDQYVKTWNASSILIAQIESVDALKEVEKILSHRELDGVMIGPYDVSGSLGIPGQLNHEKVKKVCQEVIRIARKKRKGCGTQIVQPDREGMEEAIKSGFTFSVLASDIFSLRNWASEMKDLMKVLRRKKK